jgi:hypothetical protein
MVEVDFRRLIRGRSGARKARDLQQSNGPNWSRIGAAPQHKPKDRRGDKNVHGKVNQAYRISGDALVSRPANNFTILLGLSAAFALKN